MLPCEANIFQSWQRVEQSQGLLTKVFFQSFLLQQMFFWDKPQQELILNHSRASACTKMWNSVVSLHHCKKKMFEISKIISASDSNLGYGCKQATLHRLKPPSGRFFSGLGLHVPYIDDSLFVSEQEVSEETGLVHVSQFDHVINALHWCRVHDPERGFLLRRQTLFLVHNHTRTCH